MANIFITGATGFLGTEIVSEIIRTTENTVYALIRASSSAEASDRLLALWYERPELKDNIGTHIIPVPGDITEADLGLSPEDESLLIHNTDYIIHTAALIGINHTREEFLSVNVAGTEHVLDFARRIHADHVLRRFSHVSTAYVAGSRSGLIMEDSLVDAGFSSLYEQSKFEGESLVEKAKDDLPVSIFRPGQIVGDSKTGYVKNFNTLYYPLKLYMRGQLRFFPIKSSMRVNMVPADYVAGAIVRITFADGATGKTFHLTAPSSMQPTVAEFMKAVREWAEKNLSMHLPEPVFLPLPFLNKIGSSYNMSDRGKGKKSILTNMISLTPYFSENKTFDTTNTESFMGVYDPDWYVYLPKLLNYAVNRNFLDDNSRTVFEQVWFCLKRQHTSITYYDVTVDGNIIQSSAEEVEERIETVLRSLQAFGVGPGGKVAITGINSVSYFVLDVAIGLSGAASVPLYYTTPADELNELLKKSGAEWFFIGDKRILSKVDRLKFDGKIISFTGKNEEENVSEENTEEKNLTENEKTSEKRHNSTNPCVMSWDEFIALGNGKDITPVQVSYDDIATIRYTSGTTGNSKSVEFTHYQLRWMAQTMASLLSFKSRTGHVTYLSFLPLSHVVEGILGAYTPYYIGAPLSLYFLNDFDKAAQTLPKVRPTIFFSVPRFYEKVWDQLAGNRIGNLYISTYNALLKKILRPILKRTILKRAGLDKCDQLIVGSAPVSQTLLENFRDLGIEIHNAYGLTEAPLITLNRSGSNKISTVGTPLPDTEVTLADDGEILVRGPQVASVYDGKNSDTLHTGDLGVITEDGYLKVVGRKKEILINSYGKNINLQKVETLLKDIPGISEAMLLAESRPYCIALLWPDEDVSGPDEETLTLAVSNINEQLSHPEQIKRYALMADPLKTATGELTPNLKLRRDNIAEIHRQTIDGLYAPTALAAGNVLFIGIL